MIMVGYGSVDFVIIQSLLVIQLLNYIVPGVKNGVRVMIYRISNV